MVGYLKEVGGEVWLKRVDCSEFNAYFNNPQGLAGFDGHLSYRS